MSVLKSSYETPRDPIFQLEPERWFTEKFAPMLKDEITRQVEQMVAREMPALVGALIKDALTRQIEHRTLIESLDAAIVAEVDKRRQGAA